MKKIVKPRLDYYLQKSEKLHQEFGDLVLRHATETFGCDRQCLIDCVKNPTLVSFWDIPMCLRHCNCTLKRLFDIENNTNYPETHLRRDVNLHHVMREGDYDEAGMNFLK